jgi:hypothetical protein
MVSLSGRYQCNRETYLRRLPYPNQPMPTCQGVQAMKLTRRGRLVRAVMIYVLILTAIIGVSSALGVWDVSESCLVEQVGCPAGYLP